MHHGLIIDRIGRLQLNLVLGGFLRQRLADSYHYYLVLTYHTFSVGITKVGGMGRTVVHHGLIDRIGRLPISGKMII